MNDRTEKKRKPRARMQALLTNRMKRKLALVFALIVLALLGVSVRLAYINKIRKKYWRSRIPTVLRCHTEEAIFWIATAQFWLPVKRFTI